MPASADPDLALRLAKATADLYSDAAERILAQVARRLAQGIDRPGWAEAKLLEVARLRDQARAIVERLETLGPAAISEAVTAAYTLGAAAGAAEVGVTFGVTNTRAVDALVRETVTLVRSTHVQILRTAEDVYRSVIAEASAPRVLTGVETRRQAAQRALDRFATRGVTGFVDARGKRWGLESYAEMATRTSVGRAQVQGTLDRFTEAGRDLVIVSDAPQECPQCRPWEGWVLSISGAAEGYPSLAAATGSGLLHANCRHALTAYQPGVTKRPTHTADPEGDRNRQQQRYLERGVRHWKRRAAVALDEEGRRYAQRHVREWQGRLKAHVDRNGLKRLRYREQIGAAI